MKGKTIFESAYQRIKQSLNAKKVVMEQIRNDYRGPRLITFSITNPIDLACTNEMSYDAFLKDLNRMVDALAGFYGDVLGEEGAFMGSDNYVKVGVYVSDNGELAELLKTPIVGASIDPEIGSLIYDISQGDIAASEIDDDPVGALARCELVNVTEISNDDYYEVIRRNESNIKDFFANPEYLENAQKQLEGNEADNGEDNDKEI